MEVKQLKKYEKEMIDRYTTKRFNNKTFALSILQDVYQGCLQREISKKLNMSKQNACYYFRKLKEEGLIKKKGYGVWEVTPRGFEILKKIPSSIYVDEEGKEIVQIEDKHRPMFDLHHITYEFPLKDEGNLKDIKKAKLIKFGNWQYIMAEYQGYTMRVNRGKEPKLLIHAPKEYGRSTKEAWTKACLKLFLLVVSLQKEYNCKIDIYEARLATTPHYHSLHDPLAEKLAQNLKYSGTELQINESGGAHIDLLGVEAAQRYESLLMLPESLDYKADNFMTLLKGIDGKANSIHDVKEMFCELAKQFSNLFNVTAQVVVAQKQQMQVMDTFRVAMSEHLKLIAGLQEVTFATNKLVRKLSELQGVSEGKMRVREDKNTLQLGLEQWGAKDPKDEESKDRTFTVGGQR